MSEDKDKKKPDNTKEMIVVGCLTLLLIAMVLGAIGTCAIYKKVTRNQFNHSRDHQQPDYWHDRYKRRR